MRHRRKDPNIREKDRKYAREYYAKNKAKIHASQKRRRITNPNYRISRACRERIRAALKGLGGKTESTRQMIGTNIEVLKWHLESLFKPGMNWENYGEWHIDHIRPCADFDLTDLDQQKACFHYTNLQPLWAVDNLRKSSKVFRFDIRGSGPHIIVE